jgi:CubicO group peptidase (beta-lactamase class C family)
MIYMGPFRPYSPEIMTCPRRRTRVCALLLAVALPPAARAAAQDGEGGPPAAVEALDAEIRAALAEGGLPSLTVAVVDRGGVVWSGAYGYSNRWARTPATPETVYLIGSTFKAQSALALLQQMERGAFDLDEPVRDWLTPFRIRREDPTRPVTFRQLLTHTSGLPAAFGAHSVWGETLPPPLDAYVRDSLALVADPGTEVVYSNVGFALVGWLVERVSGERYADYVRERVWQPLGMTSTAFAPTPWMEERLAIPYVRGEGGALEPTVWLKADVWPAGVVYGTVLDQARWLAFNLGDGATADGVRLLEPGTLEAMQTLQDQRHAARFLGAGWGYGPTGYGFGWWTTTRAGERFFAHAGGVPGYSSFLMGNRDRGVGVVLLTNGDRAEATLVRLANRALDLFAPPELPAASKP